MIASLRISSNHKPIRVLLIEDDEDDFIITKNQLDEIAWASYETHWCSSYESALKEITENNYDVYLIDYRLQDKIGLELIESIAKVNPFAPFILLTGYEDIEIDSLATQLGASDYLVKNGIDANRLDRSIRYAINQKLLQKEITDNEQKKELYLATIAHDLKAPILGERRILEQLFSDEYGALNTPQKTVVHELLKSNQHLYHMVLNILSSYRYESGNVVLKKECLNINPIIQHMVDQGFLPLLTEKNQTLVCALDPKAPDFMFDPFEIERVIQNIVYNAIQNSPKNGKILVQTHLDEKMNHVTVSVTDEGPGIPPELKPKIFSPFCSNTHSLKSVGTGLGLYLAKMIISSHEGRIDYTSDKNKGTVFYFTLPLEGKPLSTLSTI